MPSMKIVIVGGVAGGATAAARARRLSEDAEIIMLERGPDVSFANCGLPYHIGGEIAERDALLLQTPESLKARYNIDVRVRSEVLAIDREARDVAVRNLQTNETYRLPYDKLLLSPGAAPIRPPLPGIDHDRIYTLRNVPDTDRIKSAVDGGAKSAIVVGAGFIGLEVAENLRRRGLEVHLVELLDQVMPPLDKEMTTVINQTLALNGVRLLLGDAVEAFADEGGQVRATLRSGAALTADMVVLAVGVRPENKLAKDANLELTDRGAIVTDEHMRTSDENIYAVGDAVAVKDFINGGATLIPLAGPANRQARIAIDNMFGRSSKFRGSQGTSIVRVFDVTVASTGASEKTLKRINADYDKVYVHPHSHVGYYPGAAQMTIKLLFNRITGRVLGAQITGTEGVDKRIDVIATAIQAGMTVYDLEEVELAYAPQFGAAKDPINMAGFVAANSLRGDVEHIHADQLGDTLVLDVRNPDECETGTIPGAKIVPLPLLRRHHAELPRDRTIACYCQVGLRGYIAARILKQMGYQVKNVSGGFKTYCAFNPDGDDGACLGGAETNERGELIMRDKPASDSSCESNGCSSGASPTASASGTPDEKLDVRGACCPGPIVAVAESMRRLGEGKVLEVVATDIGFATDIPAWCRRTGNELLGAERQNGHIVARIRKGQTVPASQTTSPTESGVKGKTILVFSGDLDKVMAAFIIANGAAATEGEVTMFFTFWGLNALRRDKPPRVQKNLVERMFGWMMPRGATKLSLSKMNMFGMGTAMMKNVMASKNVDSLPALMESAQRQGVRMVACSMSMDVMGISQEELIDGVEVGGVGAYLGAAEDSRVNLFV